MCEYYWFMESLQGVNVQTANDINITAKVQRAGLV